MTVAHLNWAYLKAPWSDPAVAGFVDNVDRVNALAARSPGFVWNAPLSDFRLRPLLDLVRETGGPFDPGRLAVTLSVWESADALGHFVYRTLHGRFLDRRADWFVAQGVPNYVIWPIPDGHRPTISEGKARIIRLRDEGASSEAYDFKWLQAQAA